MMTIASFQLDPNAAYLSDNAVVDKINLASVNITRVDSVSAAARPIAEGEVGATELENEAFLAAEKTKLTGVEPNAKDDQTGGEIKTAYELEANTYNDTKDTKLTGIAAGAEVNPTDTDELAEGTTNKYDTGAPPANTDELTEGAANKYDTGVPPSTLEELPDGATRLAMADAEKTKLTGIEAGAKDDQTGVEVRDLVVALADTERKIVITNPLTGEFKIVAVQRDAAGELDVDYDDVPIP